MVVSFIDGGNHVIQRNTTDLTKITDRLVSHKVCIKYTLPWVRIEVIRLEVMGLIGFFKDVIKSTIQSRPQQLNIYIY
jgi:hypothetical protein